MTRIISISSVVMLSGLVVAMVTAIPSAGAGDEKAKGLYEKMCANCHGSDGSGNAEKAAALKIDAKLLNLGRAESANYTRDELRTILLDGKEKMPGYKRKLKAPDQEPVLDYTIELAKALRAK